eukprot:143868-Amphidinium_carterae.2
MDIVSSHLSSNGLICQLAKPPCVTVWAKCQHTSRVMQCALNARPRCLRWFYQLALALDAGEQAFVSSPAEAAEIHARTI